MTDMNEEFSTIAQLQKDLRDRKISAQEITKTCLDRIGSGDGKVGSFLSVRAEAAQKEAEAADRRLAEGLGLAPMTGIPVALKDNMLLEGEVSTAGSRILEHYEAAYDSFVASRLKEEGAVILGKTNLDEFAMGSSTENSAYQVTRNPHDLDRVAGGSSGGSAAAVAAGFAVAALGSDTGGSIRQPAGLCGVVGLKPTYGRVSRSGLIALASSLDQIGTFTKTVADARILFDAIRGHDPMDATSAQGADEVEVLPWDKVKEFNVGIPEEYFIEGLDPTIKEGVEATIAALKDLGVGFRKISLPHTKYALSSYYIVMPAEASANLARFDGIRYGRTGDPQKLSEVYLKTRGAGFGRETKRRIILGTFVLSSGYYDAYYAKAQQVRGLIKHDFDQAFREVDVILTPVTPAPAFKVGEKTADPLAMYLSDIFTIPVNLAGLPGISIPCRNHPGTLPVGFQLIGRHFREADILSLGEHYEKNTA